KNGKQLPIKNHLVLSEGLEILLGKAVAHLLLLLNGQDSDSAFGSVTAVFQKGLHPRPPAEPGVLHQGPGMVQQLGLLVAQSVKHQFLLGGEETVEEGLGDPYFSA